MTDTMAHDTNAAEKTPIAPMLPPITLTPVTAETDKIYAAIVKAQSGIAMPSRNRQVSVKTKTGGTYTFAYATLDHIIEQIRKPLTSNGLWFVQTLEEDAGGKFKLVTTVIHESGQAIASRTPLLVEEKNNQQFGSALTYMRRYALTAILGIAAEDDDDSNFADGNKITSKWHGPLARSTLTKQIREMRRDLELAEDLETFDGVLFAGRAVIAQMEVDMATEWFGPVDAGTPWKDVFDALRVQLQDDLAKVEGGS